MGALLGLMAATCVGVSDLYARRVVSAADSLTAAVAVSLVAIVTSLVALGAFGSSYRGDDLLISTVSGVLLGVGLLTYYRGIVASSATVVSPLVGTISAVIPFGYAVAVDGAPSAVALVGAAIALAGISVISGSGGRARHISAGVRWGLVSGVFYGVAFALVLETADDAGALPATMQRVGASLILVGLAARRTASTFPPVGVRGAALLGGVFAGLSSILYIAGLRVDPTAAVITTSMFPAASVAVGRVFFGDGVTAVQAFGIAVALLGTALTALG